MRERERERDHEIIATFPRVGNRMFRAATKKEGQKCINHGVVNKV